MIDHTSSRTLTVCCLLLVAILSLGPLTGLAASDYELTADDEVDTPTRTVEIKGDSYTISSIAVAQVDGSIGVSVQVPDGANYALDVFNDEEQAVIDTRLGSGPGTETLDLSTVEPGTYALTLQSGGNVVDVKPLVVEGVSVSLDVPSDVGVNDSVTATVQTSSLDGESTPQSVELAVWTGESAQRVDATKTSPGTYEATIPGLEAGEYQVYAAAQGSGTVMGEPAIIGVSDRTVVTVTDETNDGGDEGGTGDDGDDETDGNETDGTETTDNGTVEEGNSTDGGNESESSDDGTGEDNESLDGPQLPTEPPEGDDGADSTPTAGPVAVLVALSLAVATRTLRDRS